MLNLSVCHLLLSMGMAVKEQVEKLPLEDAFVLYCLPVINQWEVLGMAPPGALPSSPV